MILLTPLPADEAEAFGSWPKSRQREPVSPSQASLSPFLTSAHSSASFHLDHSGVAQNSANRNTTSPDWGLLASAPFDHQQIKSVYFFAGNWRCCHELPPVQFYEYPATPNEILYTVHPSDAWQLGWSERPEYRSQVLDMMMEAGANVVTMSYWGQPGTDRWAYWAPMYASTLAHDQLFTAAIDKNIFIMPAIESSDATIGCGGHSPAYHFASDFPGSKSDPAPQLVTQIEDLIQRYLKTPTNPAWPSKWVQMYDRAGHKRYAINILHVASNRLGADEHERFARGFDQIAHKIFQDTGILVGFTLDLLPAKHAVNIGNCGTNTMVWDTFTPSPEKTGPYLRQQVSFLAVQAFIPEIWVNQSSEADLIAYKSNYLQGWLSQRVPVLLDVSPGYDAHRVFPGSKRYGQNEEWRTALSALHTAPIKGITFNTWNGYTEGYAAMSTLEYGDAVFQWLQKLFKSNSPDS